MNKTIVGILVVLGIGLILWLVLTRSRTKGGTFGYRFFRHMESPGGNITHLPELSGNVKELKRACNEHPDCIAFTSDGYLKKAIVNPERMEERSGYPDWYGIYVHPKVLRS